MVKPKPRDQNDSNQREMCMTSLQFNALLTPENIDLEKREKLDSNTHLYQDIFNKPSCQAKK